MITATQMESCRRNLLKWGVGLLLAAAGSKAFSIGLADSKLAPKGRFSKFSDTSSADFFFDEAISSFFEQD
ncbi:hypothetical protein CCUS01_16413 [Colletotrichum cuscutae]|uniref:Uncharacterized protein n=1 Tax=Colletotrichum cuscutae TaxID=1209917 RepID=A0AAI9VA51_9PEZI|nr:hypothetical protein CCUS01_16413 [Colletotrichum cuscutae]